MDDDESLEAMKAATRDWLVARAKSLGCTCPEPVWRTWEEIWGMWDTLDPRIRARFRSWRTQVTDPSDMVIIDHEQRCVLHRMAQACWN